ncbi:MAG: Eco47II family restriction endonuclease [Candidatus Micrarchaeia archaeon]
MTNKFVKFVSDEHFLKCVKHVVSAYPPPGQKLDMAKLQRNTLDPFKMVFDILNGGTTISAWIKGEEIRQKDKTINNRIGEFHQMLLGGVDGWVNLGTGDETKVDLRKGDNTIFIELKNKFNTPNSDSLSKVREKLKSLLQAYPNSRAYWAYILDKNGESYDVIWKYGNEEPDERLRKISGKKVYELITGDPKALEAVWKALPKAISKVIKKGIKIPDSEKIKLLGLFKASIK